MSGKHHIRWLIRMDMPGVMAIEQASFECPWTESEFIRQLRHRNVISLVADLDCVPIGYVMYELNKDNLTIINIAVAESSRRRQVGSDLVRKIIGKVQEGRRSSVIADVREDGLSTQLFFKSLGFRATEIIRRPYDGYELDAYRMSIGGGNENAS